MFSVKLLCRRVPNSGVLLVRGVHKGYYDALGLTPKATQADIKQAYYKMSMVYHPDKEHTGNPERFKMITMAYEVLGNNKLRKMYDKGMLPGGAVEFAHAVEQSRQSPTEEGFRPQSQRVYENITVDPSGGRKTKTYSGKTEHFDYDAWTHAHYEELFTKRQAAKAREEFKKQKKSKFDRFRRIEFIIGSTFVSLVLFTIYYNASLKRYDRPGIYRP